MSNLNGETYYGKISKLAKKMDKLDAEKVISGISLLQEQKNIETKDDVER